MTLRASLRRAWGDFLLLPFSRGCSLPQGSVLADGGVLAWIADGDVLSAGSV